MPAKADVAAGHAPRALASELAAATAVSASFAGYRHLAIRVIDQARRDLVSAGGSPGDRESARRFLAGSPMLTLWCAVADVNPEGVHARPERVPGRRRRRPREWVTTAFSRS